ncbi:unnamed protein product [Scytosiphon promiscuus]
MAETNDSAENDRAGSDAAVTELMVLDRLLYRNRSQHRSGKYFTHLLEVRRACRMLAAPKVPDLLAQGLSLIARVPDSRNGRAREAWVRSAAAGLRRMRVSVSACASSLETIMLASRHLAHQVSQTYFMALSTVFLACLARLFACNLHLGGRLLEVHGALLRTLLAQPCTSECLSASGLAECRVPADTASFLTRLRGSGSTPKTPQRKRPQSRSSGGSGAAAAAAANNPLPAASGPATNNSSSGASSSGEQGGTGSGDGQGPSLTVATASSSAARPATQVAAAVNDDDYDVDDPGVHIGRAAPTEAADGDHSTFPSAEVSIKGSAAAGGSDGGGRPHGAVVAQDPARSSTDEREHQGGETARGSGTAGAVAGSKSETSRWRGDGGGGEGKRGEDAEIGGGATRGVSGAGGASGSGGGSRARGVTPSTNHQRKKVILASEFSDSSCSSSEDEDEGEGPGVVGGIRSTNKSGRHETPSPPSKDPPQQRLASTVGVVGVVGVATNAALPLPSEPSLRQPPSNPSAKSPSEPRHSEPPRNPHPDPKTTSEIGSSPAAPPAAAEVALSAPPPGSPCHVDAKGGDLADTAPAATPQAPTTAAAVLGSGEPLGWVIDSRPSPIGNTPPSRGRQKGRGRGGNKSPPAAAAGAAGAAAPAADPCGVANPASGSRGLGAGLREQAGSTTSAAKVSGKVVYAGDGGDDVDRESSGGAKPGTEPELVVRGVVADVAETVAGPRYDASCEPGGSAGSGSPEIAPRSSKDPAPGRSAATIDSERVRGAAPAAGGVSGGADVAGVKGGGGGAGTAAARPRRSELQEAKRKDPPSKKDAETEVAVASNVGPGAVLALGRQAPRGKGSVKIKAQSCSGPGEARVAPPSGTGKEANSGGGGGGGRNGGSGTKRRSSHEGREETPKRLKKPKKETKKRKKGASSGGLGGGKRNAIDDIFGSLL